MDAVLDAMATGGFELMGLDSQVAAAQKVIETRGTPYIDVLVTDREEGFPPKERRHPGHDLRSRVRAMILEAEHARMVSKPRREVNFVTNWAVFKMHEKITEDEKRFRSTTKLLVSSCAKMASPLLANEPTTRNSP